MFTFNQRIKIGRIIISNTSPVCVVAEVGVNHNGRLVIAKKLIDAAAKAGAHIVKFQTFDTDEFMADKNAVYSYRTAGKTKHESMYKMFKRLELPFEWHKELLAYCRKKHIQFLSTPCDPKAVDLLDQLKVPAYKISSEDLINVNLLEYVARRNKPVILSTGMANEKEINMAVKIFRKHRHKDLILLQCTSLYPVPPKEVNLKRMQSLAGKYRILTGFSDHSESYEAAVGSVYMGAVLVEKHFTLSKEMPGPDHQFSLEPKELEQLVRKICQAEALKGSGEIIESKTEEKEKLKFRRSIVAARDLAAGTRLKKGHLAFKRPGDGLRPYEKNKILGKILKRNVPKNKKILFPMV